MKHGKVEKRVGISACSGFLRFFQLFIRRFWANLPGNYHPGLWLGVANLESSHFRTPEPVGINLFLVAEGTVFLPEGGFRPLVSFPVKHFLATFCPENREHVLVVEFQHRGINRLGVLVPAAVEKFGSCFPKSHQFDAEGQPSVLLKVGRGTFREGVPCQENRPCQTQEQKDVDPTHFSSRILKPVPIAGWKSGLTHPGEDDPGIGRCRMFHNRGKGFGRSFVEWRQNCWRFHPKRRNVCGIRSGRTIRPQPWQLPGMKSAMEKDFPRRPRQSGEAIPLASGLLGSSHDFGRGIPVSRIWMGV